MAITFDKVIAVIFARSASDIAKAVIFAHGASDMLCKTKREEINLLRILRGVFFDRAFAETVRKGQR